MTNAVIAQGLARQSERPDIHQKVEKLTNIQSGYPAAVATMVLDLKQAVPELSIRQLSVLVGISTKAVFNALDSATEQKEWSPEDNPASSAAELAALRKHHDRYIDCVSYTLFDGRTADVDEWSDVPAIITAPALSDPHRRADQSHTIKRPISLATRPYNVAA